MRVVVVGGTGNVGTSVVERLGREPGVSEVTVLARRPPRPGAPGGATFVPCDVTTDPLAPVLRGADAVVHLAWLFQPTHDPVATWRTNVEGSQRVFEAAAAAGVGAVLYASSVGAYSPAPDGAVVDESWPTHSLPTAAYGREKAYVERILDAFELRHPRLRVVRMRPAFIFKREAASEQRRLFVGPLLPGLLARRGRLPVLPLPRGLRFQALHSSDVAEAFTLALRSDVRGAFNLAGPDALGPAALGQVLGVPVVELPRAVVRAALAAAWHARLVPAAPTLVDLVLGLPLLDAGRARAELGWIPRYGGAEALEELRQGVAAGAGAPTAPLAPDSPAGRGRELATGVGGRP